MASVSWGAVLRAGSYAAESCKSRQVRKEAAVSSVFRVP